MLRSVHDHPDGRNGTVLAVRAVRHGPLPGRGPQGGRGFHVDPDGAGGPQVRALLAPDDAVGSGQCTEVDGPAGYGPGQCLGEQSGTGAGDRAARVPGLLGDDQVAGAHAGQQPGAESGGEHRGSAQSRRVQGPGDGAVGRARAHTGAQDFVPLGRARPAAAAQGRPLDAQRAGDQQRRDASGGGSRAGAGIGVRAHQASSAAENTPGSAYRPSGPNGSPYR